MGNPQLAFHLSASSPPHVRETPRTSLSAHLNNPQQFPLPHYHTQAATTTTSAHPPPLPRFRPPKPRAQPDQVETMLEEAIPALWSAFHGFFTPAVLFILLNVVIGTIAVTSKVAPTPAAAPAGAGGGADHHQQQRGLSRVPSMAFERLRSFNLSRFAAPAPEPDDTVTGVVDLGLGYEQPPAPEKEETVAAAEPEREAEQAHAHMERSRSEAAAELEVPRLPTRLHKSASENSAFSHFEAEEVEEAVQAVEARRPATTRDGARAVRHGRRLPVVEPEEEVEEEAGGEVDAQAENFINRFHNQLKLQRMESILRYRETIRRGQAAAAAGGV